MELFSESLLDRKLFEEVKGVVWYIELTIVKEGNPVLHQGSGFSVTKDGCIMTCDHLFPTHGPILNVEARNYCESIFRSVEVVRRYSKLDVAILQVKEPISCNYGQFSSNGSLYPGQPLASLGYPHRHPGTFVVGRASHHCVDVDMESLPKDDDKTCANYESSAVSRPQPYWKIGDSLDYTDLGNDFNKELHPLTPIIISSGLASYSGHSGSPVFKSDGTIIGMVIRTNISIHVSMLKVCLEDAALPEEESSLPFESCSSKGEK